jgi:hypothetical protein
MSYNIYSVPRELTSPKVAKALHAATGFDVYTDNIERPGGWMGFASPYNWNTFVHARDNNEDYIYVDGAYFGRRVFYRVTKNGLWHNGEGQTDCRRLKKFYHKPKNWVKGKFIIICPQSGGYFERNGMDRKAWINKVKYRIRKHTDRRIIVKQKHDPKPLKAYLKNAWMVVSHTSNSALEAIMEGVPAISTGLCHASPLCTDGFANIENPYYPENRMEFAGVLADNQFTLEEIRKGRFLMNMDL